MEYGMNRPVRRRRGRRGLEPDNKLILILVIVVLILAAVAGGLYLRNRSGKDGEESSKTAENTEKYSGSGNAGESASGENPGGSESAAPESTAGQAFDPSRITYPLSQTPEAGDDYFKDALFIGDSRTIGFQMHSGIMGATFYTDTWAAAKTAMTKPFIPQTALKNRPEGASSETKVTLQEALQADKSFGKVYIGFGINETGYEDWEVLQYYNQLIDLIQSTMPEAIIYVQSVVNVTAERSAKGDYVNNDKINHFNEIFLKMAQEQGVCFVNINEALTADGVLPADASSDGVHFLKSYYQKWYQYLKKHAV